MIFKFFLENTEIDEPVGFDATKMKLTRSENYHGIIAETDSQSVEFYGIGFQILKQEYDEKGIDASIGFTIKYACGDTFETLGEYSVTFYNSEWYCGDDCYCKVGIERKGCIYQLKNGMDTKVNLESATSIDGETDIGNSQYLGIEKYVPPKSIVLTDSAYIKEIDDPANFTAEFQVGNGIGSPGNPYDQTSYFHSPYPLVTLEELDEFNPLTAIAMTGNYIAMDYDIPNQYFFKAQSDLTLTITAEFKALVTAIFYNYLSIGVGTFHHQTKIQVVKKNGSGPDVILDEIAFPLINAARNCPVADPTCSVTTTSTQNVDQFYSGTFNLLAGDMIVIGLLSRCYIDDPTGLDVVKLNVKYFENNKLTLTNLSQKDATKTKLYMVNEALSKTSEYVTNGCLKVYSEFFGRVDSDPYNMDKDGCGSMLALTKGQLLRQLEIQLTGDKTPIFSLSFNDILKALDSIYGVGYTIEEKGDNEVLRIEDWQYFYQDNILTDIGSVSITTKPNLKLHFKRFRTGYNKYEAEEYNGIDEFLTEREYTTQLVNHNAVAEKVCDFIASGYAIELTRRQSYLDTKDWRFDNDTFLLCMKRIAEGNTIVVEQGNINNSANIIDPDTILNYRISPARMAMNLFRYLTTFIKGTKELIFSNGKGNIAAQGELDSVCSIEAGVISEKQNLTQSDFAGSQEGIFTAELHEIENVPLTFEQYKTIRSNPHGLIAYKCDEVQRYGWIQSLEYSFVDGDATLILIPKNA